MIKIEHLNKQFGDHAALKDVSLEFPEHQTTVILGPSGSGKSTLLRSLDLLERPESGHFAFDQTQIDYSQPISESTVLDVRRRTEMVFQQFNLFPHLTVLQNVIEVRFTSSSRTPRLRPSGRRSCWAKLGWRTKPTRTRARCLVAKPSGWRLLAAWRCGRNTSFWMNRPVPWTRSWNWAC